MRYRVKNRIGHFILAFAWFTGMSAVASAQSTTLAIGCMQLDLSDSWTAQLFHIVDQISHWDNYAHGQYIRWAQKNLTLTAQDSALLRRHAELRKARGWNNGYEQSFLVDGTVDDAAKAAVARKALTEVEAAAEDSVLSRFSVVLTPLREASAAKMAAFRRRLSADAKRIEPTVKKLCAFSETKEIMHIPLYIVTNPEEGSGGGEANSGRIVIEIEDSPDPVPVLFHESLHMLLRASHDSIAAAATRAGVNFTVMNEAIAYAFAPGLTDDGQAMDNLPEALARFLIAGRPLTDVFVQDHLMAMVLRPVLRQSLARGETIQTFLPAAVAKWKSATGH